MTDQTWPAAPPRIAVPGQRAPADHPMRPDLGDPAWMPPQHAVPDAEPYAHWWRRVVATVIDALLAIPFWVAGVIGFMVAADGTTFYTDGTGGPQSVVDVSTTTATWVGGSIALAAYVGLIVFTFWNQVFRQGRRGASVGKACLCLMVVDETNGRPIGAFATFIRGIAHLVDALVFYLGYLWPLVDPRRQTFADKLMSTVVLYLPPLAPRAVPQIPHQAAPPGW